jgi:murein DD-endopeptidase MepM/ murein hydrolase activator NlpD
MGSARVFVAVACIAAVAGIVHAPDAGAAPTTGPELVPFRGTHQITATWGAPSGGYHSTPAIDVSMSVGTTVYAAGAGTVIEAGGDRRHCDPRNYANGVQGCINAGFGNSGLRIRIQHPDGRISQYLHLDRIGPGVTKGAWVVAAQRIASSGNTGISTGPHLHYAEWSGGKEVDPGGWVSCHGATRFVYTSLQTRVRQSITNDAARCALPAVGKWVLTNSLQPQVDTADRIRLTYGDDSYIPVAGDWDGDGRDTPGVFQPSSGRWVLTNSLQPQVDTGNRIRLTFGDASYLPVVGDWDGDGRDNPGVFQPSSGRWVLTNSLQPQVDTGNRIRLTFGDASYLPVAGNWDGFGGDNPGVFRPSTGQWVLTNSLHPEVDTTNRIRFTYGDAKYRPVAGNWDAFGGDNAGVGS